jgi:hypothetical protein
MSFHLQRRQQFLGESYYLQTMKEIPAVIEMFTKAPAGSGDTEAEGWAISARRIAANRFEELFLLYTAGEAIEPLRHRLETVVAAYERYGDLLWKNTQDRNEPVFQFAVLDEYCQLMQLIGLCFLLHRRDLLPRIAAMQDGEGGKSNGGADTLFEELMAYGLGPETRFESDWLCHKKPYEPLFHGLTETTPAKGLKELDLFLKHWYKDLAGTGWHDSHKPDEHGNQGGYYGYWSFEAGAAVLLLGIEDDSSLYRYLYYPKDMVAWARQNMNLADTAAGKASIRLRCEAGQPCPREGWWFTPARMNSRRHFKTGEIMPDLKSDWGMTIWQWDEQQ